MESIAGCRELCIQASNYVCRSATYYTNIQTCKLSEESRRSAPASFRPAIRGTFYLENECAVCKFDSKTQKKTINDKISLILGEVWVSLTVSPSSQCQPTASTSTCRATISPSPTPTSPTWRTSRRAGTSATGRTGTTAGPSTTTRTGRSASSPQVSPSHSESLSSKYFVLSDDSISLPTQLQQDPSFVFSEKSGCNNGKWKPETANQPCRDKH